MCLLALHPTKPELLAASVGDSGFLVLRRESGVKRMGTLGAAREGGARSGGYQVVFRSPQQLRGFNAPYQLGRAPDVAPGEADDRFETPHDAALVRVPIKGGDLVVHLAVSTTVGKAQATDLGWVTDQSGQPVAGLGIAARPIRFPLQRAIEGAEAGAVVTPQGGPIACIFPRRTLRRPMQSMRFCIYW